MIDAHNIASFDVDLFYQIQRFASGGSSVYSLCSSSLSSNRGAITKAATLLRLTLIRYVVVFTSCSSSSAIHVLTVVRYSLQERRQTAWDNDEDTGKDSMDSCLCCCCCCGSHLIASKRERNGGDGDRKLAV